MGTVFSKIEQREIWLLPFPFSNLRGNKVRPVLILSKNQFNNNSDDVVVCGITSNLSKKDYYAVNIANNNLEEGHLLAPFRVKVENILKIDKELLIKKIGSLKKSVFSNVLKKLDSVFY